jgi:hypothetical protein
VKDSARASEAAVQGPAHGSRTEHHDALLQDSRALRDSDSEAALRSSSAVASDSGTESDRTSVTDTQERMDIDTDGSFNATAMSSGMVPFDPQVAVGSELRDRYAELTLQYILPQVRQGPIDIQHIANWPADTLDPGEEIGLTLMGQDGSGVKVSSSITTETRIHGDEGNPQVSSCDGSRELQG